MLALPREIVPEGKIVVFVKAAAWSNQVQVLRYHTLLQTRKQRLEYVKHEYVSDVLSFLNNLGNSGDTLESGMNLVTPYQLMSRRLWRHANNPEGA